MSHVSRSSIRWMRFTHEGLWWVGISVPLLIAMAKYMTKATKEEWILVHSSRVESIMMHNGEAGWVRGEVIHSRVLCCQCVCVCACVCIYIRFQIVTIKWLFFENRSYADRNLWQWAQYIFSLQVKRFMLVGVQLGFFLYSAHYLHCCESLPSNLSWNLGTISSMFSQWL